MYKLKFTLKQHTPLIHFQWEQAGATIRPTELKSKLDKWILQHKTHCFGLSDELLEKAKENAELSSWIKGTRKKEHPALDYRLSISSYGENSFINEINPSQTTNNRGYPILRNNDYPLYFGNQMRPIEFETGEKKIKRLSYYSAIIITIKASNIELLNEIQKEFPQFLLHTNFGTRQSKGFGCFYLDKGDAIFPRKDGQVDEEFFIKSFDYCFDIDVIGNSDNEKVKDLFNTIDLFYKTLRGGINPNDKFSMYFKSLMWKYAKSKNQQWEKKTIKQEYFSGYEHIQQSNHPEDDTPLRWEKEIDVDMQYYDLESNTKVQTNLLWRDLLGLSSEQQWGSYRANIKKTSICKSASTRFKSPLFFKPLRTGLNSYRVFFEIPDYFKKAFLIGDRSIPETEILEECFSISKNSESTLNLPYPETFDYDEFLKDALSTNPDNHVNNGDYIIKPNGKRERKTHGKKTSIRNEWIEEDNPSFIQLQSIFSQLAFQVEQKKK